MNARRHKYSIFHFNLDLCERMSSNRPFILALVSSSVAIANRAGRLVRNIVKTGELGTVDKVRCII